MKHAAPFEVKGWCPGALKPMQSGDGLIVRVRPRCGMLSPDELIGLAEAAQRFGNGHIDLTRRATQSPRASASRSRAAIAAAPAGLAAIIRAKIASLAIRASCAMSNR